MVADAFNFHNCASVLFGLLQARLEHSSESLRKHGDDYFVRVKRPTFNHESNVGVVLLVYLLSQSRVKLWRRCPFLQVREVWARVSVQFVNVFEVILAI